MKTPFLLDTISLPLDSILPSEALKPGLKSSPRYKMIAASVREAGIIEPLVVYPQLGKTGKYMLLDGHVRLEVLRDLGHTDAVCLVSTEDESCTYNIRVNRIAPIQEHRMIMKAIEAGVSEERIARALNLSPKTIRAARSKLTDITPEAIDRLKDKPVADQALRVMKKVKPFRQVEMAELMVLSNTYTTPYAKALLAATPAEQLVAPLKPDSRPEQIAKLEAEMRAIERDFVVLEESYSRDTLNLQLARGYLKALLANPRVARYLGQKHGELLAQLKRVVEVSSLEA
ncbi:MAG: ParB N-terminal domain-containing protein [Myxococcales bacterium]|nr:ParB N-terminal domain-containing protein [Myxococcales bacterium]